jgi:probable rRNA maturation factor
MKSEFGKNIDYLEINIVDSNKIVEINKKYLNHDTTTDIITFNYSKDNYSLDGEIFISLHDAIFNSKKYKVTLNIEILRLIIHGFLHLLGYDDTTITKKRVMKKMENKLVAEYKKLNLRFIDKYD